MKKFIIRAFNGESTERMPTAPWISPRPHESWSGQQGVSDARAMSTIP
jgi:hypothetical protein